MEGGGAGWRGWAGRGVRLRFWTSTSRTSPQRLACCRLNPPKTRLLPYSFPLDIVGNDCCSPGIACRLPFSPLIRNATPPSTPLTPQVVAIKAPGFGERRSSYLEDIAILTGGTVVRDEMGVSLEQATDAVLGTAAKVGREGRGGERRERKGEEGKLMCSGPIKKFPSVSGSPPCGRGGESGKGEGGDED